jgi:hypothetical protein
MHRPRRLPLCALLGLLLGVSLALARASADPPRIFKWVDSNGIAHYTIDPERVPKALRGRIESIEREARPMQPSFEPPPTAVAPAPAEALPTEAPSPREAAGASVIAPPTVRSSGEAWATRDAAPRLRRGSSLLAEGDATPEQREARAAEREAMDARIAALEAEITRDENVLKDLIADPGIDEETPLFDRPEFLEVSRRLPQLQAQLQELRDQREQLETP